MREAIASKDGNIRAALMACLLIVCFETFQGSNNRVEAQISNGVKLLHDWQSKRNRSIQDAARLGSPAPDVVEDVLYFAFCRLDIKTMISFDGKPTDYHLNLAADDFEVIKAMPSAFSTVNEAEGYLSIITRHALHIVNAACPINIRTPQTTNPAAGTAGYHPDKQFMSPADKVNLFFRIFEPEVVATRQQQDKYDINDENSEIAPIINPVLMELENWIAAFGPVFASLETAADPSGIMTADHIVAMLLHIFARGFIVRIGGAKCARETFYDRYNHYFIDMANLCERVLLSDAASSLRSNQPSSLGVVTMFDDAVVLPLLSVSTKCRLRHVRRKAIRLLREHPRRENTWDSREAALIGSVMMSLDEAGFEDDDETIIPEENRVRMSTVIRDSASHVQPRLVVKLKRGTQFLCMLVVKINPGSFT